MLADIAIGRGVAQRRLLVERDVEGLVGEQRGEAHTGAASARAHFAIDGVEFFRRLAELSGAEAHQRLAGSRCGLAQLHATLLDAVGAGGRALVRRQARVALDELDLLDRQAEFLSCDLREGRAQAGAEIDLAGIDGDRAVRMDREIGIDLLGIDRLALGSGLGEDGAGQGHGDDEAASALENVAACDDGVHPRALPEARMAAAMMRSWVPQRQRLPASASRTCASLGCGVFCRRAAVVMTMPLVQ